MIKKINQTEDIFSRLRSDGKSRLLDTPEDIDAMEKLNAMLEKDHQNFMRMQFESERKLVSVG